jgi:hypothetical protein
MYSFTYDRHDVLGYADLCHPGFLTIFRELLETLNIDIDERPMIGLYQNAVIAKPDIYLDYVENFLLPTIRFFDSCSDEIRKMLFKNANYKGVSGDRLEESIGVGHYTYHTFILERLWSLYYHIRRRKETLRYYWMNFNSRSYQPKKVDSKGKLHRFNL